MISIDIGCHILLDTCRSILQVHRSGDKRTFIKTLKKKTLDEGKIKI